MATKLKTMTVSKFKTLHLKGLTGRQLQATLVARRFDIPRNLVVSATSESLIQAWRSGKPEGLVRRDGSKLLAPSRGEETAGLRDLLGELREWFTDMKSDLTTDQRTLDSWHNRIQKALEG